MANVFDTLRTKAGDTQRSVQWYQTQVRKLGSINRNKLLREGKLTNVILPGKMYMFFYTPKHKETLPYYDLFPLVLPFRKVPGGFYGLNLHYLPYIVRFRILGILSDYATDEKMVEETRLRLNWKLLSSTSRLKPVEACVKHYLFENVESRFLEIPYPDWVVASQLPVEMFEKQNKLDVWNDSRKKF